MNNLVNHQSQHLIRIILVALAIILLNVNISAQSDSLKTLTETIINNLLDEPSDEKDNDELFELIDDLVSNPIDLNEASLSDLQRIPGMSIWNASLIVEHRKKYGSFFSVDELRLIDALTDDFVDKVKPFITINPNLTTNSTNVKNDPINIFNSLRSNLQLTMRSRVISDLQERRGFKEHEYEGSIQKIYNRFLVKYGSNISAGFVTEKDPGEKSINEFTSFHFALKNFGLIHSLVLGDYTLEFG
ncbi:MAG: helix-hairpin-helix domain-containing protein, partial [Ignavibacteriaceae bacterium]|nr:helix-hairpin-helix domain-containing protein [Ignavibacteriaceae bacterium]